MNKFWNWVTSFDVLKGIVLVVAVMIGSWYDLKAEVGKVNVRVETVEKVTSTALQEAVKLQDLKNAYQDERILQGQQQIHDEIKQLRDDLRANKGR